jgi:hypothetical protein
MYNLASKFFTALLCISSNILFAQASQTLKFVRPSGVKCDGKQYWEIKTLNDNEGKLIKLTDTPTETTVAALLKIKRPSKTRIATRWPLEKKLIVVRCTIDTSGYEVDGDIHIVIRDLKTKKTMVAEIPNPQCENVKNSPAFKLIKKAFLAYEKLSAKNTKFSGIFEITGTPFFDKIHNGVGAAPTMIEIHPVINIRKL